MPLTLEHGQSLLFANLDVEGYHTFTSVATDEIGAPIFDSGVDGMGPGQFTAVRGIEALPAGSYPFYCRVHLGLMSGTLTIT